MFFSNSLGEEGVIFGLRIYNIFSIGALATGLLLLNPFQLKLFTLLTALSAVSISLIHPDNFPLFIFFLTKIFLFTQLYSAINILSTKEVFKISMFVWSISILVSILMIFFGFANFRYILYPGILPRFAGLAIEPAGFALGTLSLYSLYVLSKKSENFSSSHTFLSYLPFIFAQSSAIVVKILIDLSLLKLIKRKDFLKLLMGFLLGLTALIFLWFNSRLAESIRVRLRIYLEQFKDLKFNIQGRGYSAQGLEALPGIIKFPMELGFLLFMVYLVCIFIIVLNTRYKLFSFLICMIPMLTETYGAVFLWIGFTVLLKRHFYLGK
jgi:hypothetical protein